MTSMREIRLEKVVVNIGAGEAGEKLVKAQKVLELVTGRKSVQTLSHRAIRDWGVRKQMPIGALVTIRGKAADAFLQRALTIRDNRLPAYSFDPRGNFSFGIADYTDFEGMKYDPDIGVFGMDVSVSLLRPGWRVSRRRRLAHPIARSHRIQREEGIRFMKDRFGLEVVE